MKFRVEFPFTRICVCLKLELPIAIMLPFVNLATCFARHQSWYIETFSRLCLRSLSLSHFAASYNDETISSYFSTYRKLTMNQMIHR